MKKPYADMTVEERRAYHTQKVRESRARITADPERALDRLRRKRAADERYREKIAELFSGNPELAKSFRAERAARARARYREKKEETQT